MTVPDLEQFLGVPADSVEADRFFDSLATFQRPELDNQEEDRWYDRLLIKKRRTRFRQQAIFRGSASVRLETGAADMLPGVLFLEKVK